MQPNHQPIGGSDPNHQGIWSPPRAGLVPLAWESNPKLQGGWVQDPTTSPSGDLIPTIRGSGFVGACGVTFLINGISLAEGWKGEIGQGLDGPNLRMILGKGLLATSPSVGELTAKNCMFATPRVPTPVVSPHPGALHCHWTVIATKPIGQCVPVQTHGILHGPEEQSRPRGGKSIGITDQPQYPRL